MQFRKLLEPIDIGRCTIKNRISMTAVNNSSQTDLARGMITQRCVDYFVERAKGGTGLIVTGVFKVENEIEKCINIKEMRYRWPQINKNNMLEYSDMSNQIHSYGGKVFFQLSAGPGRVTFPDVIASGVKPVSASANQSFYVPSVTCRPLETEEVDRIVAAFGDAAEIVAMAGVDGIEVHGHEGYLIDQFSCALWNRRTDKYGGDLVGRLTFAIEILRAIKARVGADYPVTYRMGMRHFIRGPWDGALHFSDRELGRDVAETVEVVKILQEAGYDGFSLDSGCYESGYWAHPPYYQPHGFALDMAAEIKRVAKVPIIVAGRLECPELAEKAIADGKTDLVGLGRGLLADPYWGEKVAKGQIDDIRPCLGCHEGCIERVFTHSTFLSCSVNPSCGREMTNPILPAVTKKNIAIIGGGVAGMECARVASLRGHNVTIYEQTRELGGHLIEASVPDFKADVKRLLDWYKKQLRDLKINVEFGAAVDAKFVNSLKPDAVIVATGSVPIVPEISGVDKAFVATCCDLLLGKKSAGKRVIVIGGGLEGSETALWLAMQGKKVTLVEMLPNIATGVNKANRTMLLKLIEDKGIQTIVRAKLHEVKDGKVVILTADMEAKEIECDTVALSVGMKPVRDLYDSLAGKMGEVFAIGDCCQPRKIHDAIYEGWNIGRTL